MACRIAAVPFPPDRKDAAWIGKIVIRIGREARETAVSLGAINPPERFASETCAADGDAISVVAISVRELCRSCSCTRRRRQPRVKRSRFPGRDHRAALVEIYKPL